MRPGFSAQPAPQAQPAYPGRRPFGEQLRHLREHRRLSQMALALQAEVSPRHLCFLETGRATPSREMVLRLGQCLDAPLRDRNQWLLAAGYAPMYAEHALHDNVLAEARGVVQDLLDRQMPYPAIAMDRHWHLVAANVATPLLLAGADVSLLQPPLNVLRLCHHPLGMGARIANRAQVRETHAMRLRQQIRHTGDPQLLRLQAELEGWPAPEPSAMPAARGGAAAVITPFEVHSALGVLSFVTVTTVFGPVADITLAELAIELFLPANAATAEAVQKLVAAAAMPAAATPVPAATAVT